MGGWGSKRVKVVVAVLGMASTLHWAVDAHARVTPSRAVDGLADDWRGATTGLGGTWQYSGGELVYQDHLFDDLGADTGARSQQHGTVGAPKGDFRYPTDEEVYGNNAADLLELRLSADRDSLWVLARMSTLKAPDRTVVALALDTDDDPTTGGGAWPYDAGVSVPGVDTVVTLWGTGGSITDLASGAVTPVDVAVNLDDNTIEARVPRDAGWGHVRAWAASGLWDGHGWMAVPSSSPTAGAPGGGGLQVASRVWNIAFRDGETGSFMEELQAAALAAGDITAFHADVDLDALARGADEPYAIEPGRFYAAIVDEGVSIPPMHEGLSYDGMPGRFSGVGGAALAQTFDFYGRYQPYGLYIPSTYDGVTPLPTALVLHGLGGSHSTYNSQPGFLRDMGEGNGSPDQPPMILVTPLARGSSFYADWGEADTLAVLADVQRRMPADQRRLYLTGYSMGGYGVYRLASLYPDRFAAAVAWAGYTGEFTGGYTTDPRWITGDPTGQYDTVAGAVRPVLTEAGVGGGRQGKAVIGDPVETLENLQHLPLLHSAGTNDEIVPTPGQYAAPRRLSELGYRSRFDLYPGYEHFSFALVDDWKEARAWLGNQARADAPRDITYRFSDGWTAPGLADELGLVHGNAWWVHGLTMREPTDDAFVLASISATSHALPASAVTVRRETSQAASPTPHVRQLVAWDEGAALPIENRLDLTMAGVGAVDVDTSAAALQRCGLVIGLHTDGPVTVSLDGDAVVTVDGPFDGDVALGTENGQNGVSPTTETRRPCRTLG
jgi:dienelactone hydrolase